MASIECWKFSVMVGWVMEAMEAIEAIEAMEVMVAMVGCGPPSIQERGLDSFPAHGGLDSLAAHGGLDSLAAQGGLPPLASLAHCGLPSLESGGEARGT